MTFTPTNDAWTARPSDPNDVFFAQRVNGANPKVGLFGVPFDGAVLGRKGAREGPRAIREAMAKLKVANMASVHDWGDVATPADVAGAHAAAEAAARLVLAAGHLPVALGGDHSLTFPLAKAHGKKLGVINLDAHLDIREYSGAPNSGTSFGRLFDSGIVPAANLVEVGIREFANAAAYMEKAEKAGATILSAEEWNAEPNIVIDHAIEVASRDVDAVYLSVDLDVLDQAHAPGVSAPTPEGVTTNALYAAIRRIAKNAPLAGVDFMEVAPSLDRDGMTSRAAAFAALHLFAELA